jgi:hypothetical protein
VAQRKTLTEAQLDLLQWIADSPPEVGPTGNSERVSAAALRRRGLIDLPIRRGTPSGRAWLYRVIPCVEPTRTLGVQCLSGDD